LASKEEENVPIHLALDSLYRFEEPKKYLLELNLMLRNFNNVV